MRSFDIQKAQNLVPIPISGVLGAPQDRYARQHLTAFGLSRTLSICTWIGYFSVVKRISYEYLKKFNLPNFYRNNWKLR